MFLSLSLVAGRNNLKLILGTAALGIGILLILLFYIIRKLSLSESRVFWKNRSESYQNVENILKNYECFSPKRYTYSDIKKMTNSFRVKLGQGGFGCVFKGTLENGVLVAVKVLKGLKGSGEEFINEVVAISRTSHVNIVTLLGFCFEGRNRALIYEFMPNGSLERFIYDRNSTFRQLGRETLYQIAVGISRGLEYLHRGCNMRILHFDIKPHNVLLDEDFCPKISDFGLAKLCPQKESIISLLGTRGTAGYIAPEVFCRSFGGVSHKSDVYSYGMMILEMVGGRKNIDDGVDQTTELCFPHWIYKRLELDEELRLQGNVNEEANESARKMIIVGLWCIQTDPSHRPAMSKVVEMLEGSPESLQIPPKPFLSSPSRSPAESSTTHFITMCD
ncbi:rust resistance kinase Lr10-like [Camellia sinensis]|uniref:rust resistance kinase Lr10-like n=1 Tax=Camellia sinensis TaxID=4442 RepID=UPI0010359EBC|nr:rust resistance kinase Lr10-like [Camellia sinensis]